MTSQDPISPTTPEILGDIEAARARTGTMTPPAAGPPDATHDPDERPQLAVSSLFLQGFTLLPADAVKDIMTRALRMISVGLLPDDIGELGTYAVYGGPGGTAWSLSLYVRSEPGRRNLFVLDGEVSILGG